MPICKLCGHSGKLVKAHAIPEAFFRLLRGGGEAPLMITDRKGHFPKRSPIGVYDSGILCANCEAKFGPLDEYAAQVLLNDFDSQFATIRDEGTGDVRGYVSEATDGERLLRFLVSVLWRASASTHPFYSSVNLKGLEADAARAVDTSRPLSEAFDAVLSRWKPSAGEDFTSAMLNPHPETLVGVTVYRLYLGPTIAFVKVDPGSFAGVVAEYSLRSAQRVTVVARDMAKSKDRQAMVKIAQRSYQNETASGKASRRRT